MDLYWFTNGAEIEVTRYYAESDWKRKFVDELKSRRVNIVLDVGANSGQYATGLRRADFKGRIVSFEPLAGPFSLLAGNASGDPQWDCLRCALGDDEAEVSMNVAGNAGASSSVLPMLKSHRDVLPSANYVGTEDVPMSRLDSLASTILGPDDVPFVKIDVQGFEKQVIAGGGTTIGDRCIGMQLELSFVPLYEGGMLAEEALELARSLGFVLTGFAPFFVDVRTGRLLQADGVFFRAATQKR
ncbi:FkbM family methyltransferase [Mycobacterium sp. E796]|uniref:FkbM family methyltransferase n=1 Tax=Mycobacterium sp. E796 TaxID=1834151 RepID=UPI0007FCB929|nr:FkbM family methyltransferase [Mycobacterium sp. E796]OBI59753.1 FkbM family methyltransferase [Mycobacterium sp. E796]